jgi:hypothetical protein
MREELNQKQVLVDQRRQTKIKIDFLRQNPINTAANAINETRFLIAGSELGNHFTRLQNPSHSEEGLKAKYIPCDQQFFRSKKSLEFGTCVRI